MKSFFRRFKSLGCSHDSVTAIDVYPNRPFIPIDDSKETSQGKAKLKCNNCGKIFIGRNQILIHNTESGRIDFVG